MVYRNFKFFLTVQLQVNQKLLRYDQFAQIYYLLEMSKTNSVLSSRNILSQVQSQLSNKSQLSKLKLQNKMKTIALMLNRLYINKLSFVWQRVKIIPHRSIKIQERMKSTIENVFRKQDYGAKWEFFQKMKRTSLASEFKEVQHLQQTLKKQRGTAIKLITAFVMGKKRKGLHFILKKLKEFGDWQQFKINTSYRSGIRKIIKVHNKKMQEHFNRLKSTKAIIQFVKICKNVFRLLKELKTQNTRWAFLGLRRQMLRSRKEKVGSEIKDLEEKLGSGEDEELKGLKQRYNQLNAQLEDIKKEKEEITAGLEAQIKDAQNRNKEMKDKLEEHKTKQEQMKNRIVEIDEQLKVPFSLEQIYQLCYQNFLWTVTQNTEKTYSKQELLRSLQTPIVPVDLPISQLKEENQVLKELLSEYVLMYGQKKLPQGTKIELPYQYLLKENNTLYKMLMTLLPNAQFLKDELHKIKETFETVDTSLKQLKQK